MRLRGINVYSDYLGNPEKTKAWTGQLRQDSDFLDYAFSVTTKYVNNAYLRQLNICCSQSVSETIIRRDYPEGYPEVAVPFDYSQYENMSDEEKNTFWIRTVENVFVFLETKMRCGDEKLKRYITCLHERKIEVFKHDSSDCYEKKV